MVILDNLSNSTIDVLDRIESINGIRPHFHQCDLCDAKGTLSAIQEHDDAAGVIHFAALKAIGESVKYPLRYYKNNILGLIHLIEGMKAAKIQHLVFSSSASVYGATTMLPFLESHPLEKSLSPYASTKKAGEAMIMQFAEVNRDFNAVTLRYFNPIGAHDSGRLGELPIGPPNNLMPFITQTAAGIREELLVFGDDYDTPDGTAIRDYIHVMDLADAHILTIKRLIHQEQKNSFEIFNLGTGKGSSVLEVIQSFERTSGISLKYRIVGRRDGDIPVMYSSTELAKTELHWQASRDLDDMTRSAWAWEKAYRSIQ